MLRELFVERFWLRRAERRAKAYLPAQASRIRALVRAAKARSNAAAALRSPSDAGPAFTLLREAFALYVSAWLVARGELDETTLLSPKDAWDRLDTLGASVPLPARDAIAELVVGSDALVADRLELGAALRARSELEALLGFIAAELETRSVRVIRLFRVLRVVGVVCALCIFSITTLAWALSPPKAPKRPPAIGTR